MDWILVSFLAYLISLFIIGIFSSRFAGSSLGAYFIGAGQMNRWVVAVSSVVSGRSAWLLLGFTGIAYTSGLSAIWACVGYILAECWMFLKLAPRLRRFSRLKDCITIPDLFAAKFPERQKYLRTAVSLVIFIFMLAYVSAQFVAGGKAFSATFDISYTTGMALSVGIILVYTLIGGFLAVSLTDVLQGVFMIVGLVILPLSVFISSPELIQTSINEHTGTGFFSLTNLGLGVLLGYIGIGLGSPGSPHILVRYMSIDDPKHFRFVAVIGTLANILMALGALACGMLARLVFPDIQLIPGADTENVYPHLATEYLHPLVTGVIIASIFAAIMSTADSQLLVGASTVVRDFYDKTLGRGINFSPAKWVLISRFTVFVLVLISWMLAIVADDLIFWLVLFAWAGLGAGIGPGIIAMFMWKQTSWQGILTGLITGTATVFIWKISPALSNIVYELIPAFIISIMAIFITDRIVIKRSDSDN